MKKIIAITAEAHSLLRDASHYSKQSALNIASAAVMDASMKLISESKPTAPAKKAAKTKGKP